jgi:hypothetical protein
MGPETGSCVLDIKFGAVVRPILTYTLPYCGGKKTSQISVNRKTAHLQRLACVSITRSMHSTPTAALEFTMMLPPLGIYIEGGDLQTELFWRIYRSKI